MCLYCFFFNDTATTEIYTLSLHDALPIWIDGGQFLEDHGGVQARQLQAARVLGRVQADRKSTRLNSSHLVISYAVFCLKKKKSKTAYSYCTHYDLQLHCSSYMDEHPLVYC